jgi:predicted nuclease of predicted toxin-antitoxin system
VKLLLDQNLSAKLISNLVDLFPGSLHVRDVGLQAASDADVLHFARANGFILVSKDADFAQLQPLSAPPCKIVWIRRGNCSTNDIEAILRRHVSDIALLASADSPHDVLMLY